MITYRGETKSLLCFSSNSLNRRSYKVIIYILRHVMSDTNLNLFVKNPKRGDIAVEDTVEKKLLFIALETFDKNDLSTNHPNIDIIGVVFFIRDRSVRILHKDIFRERMANSLRYRFDYGDSTSSVFEICTKENGWSNNLVSKTLSYDSASNTTVVRDLNNIFTTDSDFIAQDWVAVEEDGSVYITFDYTGSYNQYVYNKYPTGQMIPNLRPTVPSSLVWYLYDYNVPCKKGNSSNCLFNLHHYIYNFKKNTGSYSYQGNTTEERTPYDRYPPVSLETYLGSNYEGKDFCKALRDKYGADEAGWIEYLKTCLPVVPTNTGPFKSMSIEDRKEITRYYYLDTVKRQDGSIRRACPAAERLYNISTTCTSSGDWCLPTMEDLYYILKDIEYPINKQLESVSRENSDVINKALYLINPSSIAISIANYYSYWCILLSGSVERNWRVMFPSSFILSNTAIISNYVIPIYETKLHNTNKIL